MNTETERRLRLAAGRSFLAAWIAAACSARAGFAQHAAHGGAPRRRTGSAAGRGAVRTDRPRTGCRRRWRCAWPKRRARWRLRPTSWHAAFQVRMPRLRYGAHHRQPAGRVPAAPRAWPGCGSSFLRSSWTGLEQRGEQPAAAEADISLRRCQPSQSSWSPSGLPKVTLGAYAHRDYLSGAAHRASLTICCSTICGAATANQAILQDSLHWATR